MFKINLFKINVFISSVSISQYPTREAKAIGDID